MNTNEYVNVLEQEILAWARPVWARPVNAPEPAEEWDELVDIEFHTRPEKPEGEGWRPLIVADAVLALQAEIKALRAEVEALHEQLRRETELRWENNRRAAQEYAENMRDVLKEAARICKDLDNEAMAKEDRLACGAECAAAIADLAVRWRVPFERV